MKVYHFLFLVGLVLTLGLRIAQILIWPEWTESQALIEFFPAYMVGLISLVVGAYGMVKYEQNEP